MVEVRACIYFSVFFLCLHLAAGKPFLGFLMCDLLCDDDDDTTSTTASTEDYWDLWCGCGTRRPPTSTPNPMPNPNMPPINFVIPSSSSALNLTYFPASNGFFMWPINMGGGASSTAAPAAQTTAAPATTAAPTTAAA